MNNRELIHCFETDALPEAFHHADHVLSHSPICPNFRYCKLLTGSPRR